MEIEIAFVGESSQAGDDGKSGVESGISYAADEDTPTKPLLFDM